MAWRAVLTLEGLPAAAFVLVDGLSAAGVALASAASEAAVSPVIRAGGEKGCA